MASLSRLKSPSKVSFRNELIACPLHGFLLFANPAKERGSMSKCFVSTVARIRTCPGEDLVGKAL